MSDKSLARRAPDQDTDGAKTVSLSSRNIRVNGRRTSIRLESVMWTALEDIAAKEQRAVSDICAEIDIQRHGHNLTAAIRLFIIAYFRTWAQPKLEPQPGLRLVGTQTSNLGFNESAIAAPPSYLEAALEAVRAQ